MTKREEREALRADARAAQDLCSRHPSRENLKKWGLALMKCVTYMDTNGVKTTQDAREILEKALHEAGPPNDYEAMLYLGMVYYDLLRHDASLSEEEHTDLHTKAIKYLTQVKEEAPLVYAVPVIYDDSKYVDFLVQKLQRELIPREFASIESELIAGKKVQAEIRELIEIRLNQSHQYDAAEADRDEILMTIRNFEQTCNDAQRRSSEHPEDGDNWKKWGIALMKLSCYYGNASVIESIPKLQKAVELNSNDNEAKLNLEKGLVVMDYIFGSQQAAAYIDSKAASEMNEKELSGNEIEVASKNIQ